MILWLLNKLFATGDLYEDVSEELPYATGERVGGGTFGSVYVASNGNKKVAAKVLLKRVVIDEDRNIRLPRRASSLREEVAISQELGGRHHCVSCEGYHEAPDRLYVYYELIQGGTLADRLETAHFQARRWAAQLLDAVAWCHSHDISHRDLKPENVLMTRVETGGNRGWRKLHKDDEAECDLVLCDWGSARRRGCVERGSEITGFWSAPEVLAGRCSDDMSADNWSAGLVVLAMAAGRPSEADVRELHRGGLAGAEHFRARVLKVQPLTHDARAREVVAELLDPDPAARLAAGAALDFEFVRGFVA